jgi:S-adenosylmethionine hydrolase
MSSRTCISLITDFGHESPFVGVMKAVIFSRFEDARIVDIFHNVEPYNVDEGGFWLGRTWSYLPDGTVHIIVVDPGVGSVRRILAARHRGHCFLAPDNGLLEQAFGGTNGVEYRALDRSALETRLQLPLASATFHGRDIFAPVGAALAAGDCRFEELGETVSDIVPSQLGRASRTGNEVHGSVISIDHYGNLITNIDADWLGDQAAAARVLCSRHRFQIKRTYSDARAGEDIALVNSFGVLEMARAQGHIAGRLGINRGAQVVVQFGA